VNDSAPANPSPLRSGDPCPECHTGRIQVVNSKVVGESRVQYTGCRRCGFRPVFNKVIIPLQFAPRRVRATGSTGTNGKPANPE